MTLNNVHLIKEKQSVYNMNAFKAYSLAGFLPTPQKIILTAFCSNERGVSLLQI